MDQLEYFLRHVESCCLTCRGSCSGSIRDIPTLL